jgi:retron-type reverse transcriptase
MVYRLFSHTYQDIIGCENLLDAWGEFVKGKQMKHDVLVFERQFMEHLLALHHDLAAKRYTHGDYHAFNISDPKPRNIHKASVRDRLLHHALYRKLYPFFDRTFIADSYSCRDGKGTHKALDWFRAFAYKVSRNHTRTVWVLKCDIRKFFASVDHAVLFSILERYISDTDILWLLRCVVESFSSTRPGVGLPLGNLTSQLLVNIYMNEFDQFVKHKLKVKYYIRYADDFVLLLEDKQVLENLLPQIADFLEEKLKLTLHPNKVSITTFASGVDFLGWVHFPDHRVLRGVTKRRMQRALANDGFEAVVQSYLGLLRHGNTHKLQEEVGRQLERKKEEMLY